MRPKTQKRHRLNAGLIFLALVTLSFLLVGVGCQKGESDETPEEGTLIFRMTDAPADVAHLWVTLEQVSTRPCRGGGWADLPTITEAFDLIALAGDDAFKTINEASLTPYGSYCETRLMLGEEATVETTEGETYPLKVPSGEIRIKGEYEVRPGVFTIVTLDFDVDESLHRAGNSGKYNINPVIFVESVEYEPEELGVQHYYYLKNIALNTSKGTKLGRYMSKRYDWKLPDCQYGRTFPLEEDSVETFLFLSCFDYVDSGTYGHYWIMASEWFPENEPEVYVFESDSGKGAWVVYISESGALTQLPFPQDFSGEDAGALREGNPEPLRNLPLPINQLTGKEN